MAEILPENQRFVDGPEVQNVSCCSGSCSPQCFQKFANPKIYLIFFCLIGVVQGAYFTYLIGISSTLERRFLYDSKVTGMILLADNISPLLFSIILGYYGKYIHRPRLVSIGMMINVFACFLACCPYFFYAVLNLFIISKSEVESSVVPLKKNLHLCGSSSHFENCSELKMENILAISVLFTANFLKGIGSTAYYTVGTPYLDDNVKKKNSPLYLGITFAMRVFGPTLGFMLSSFCLNYYENPFVEPNLERNDPQWIGAWWIGFIIIGCCLFLTSFPILFFPRNIQSRLLSEGPQEKCKSFSDLFLSLKALFGNPILIFHTLSIIFQINGIFGYFSYVPKYIESQYRNSASSASFYTGTITLFASAPVAFLGGYCISRFKPKPKTLTGYMLFVQIFAGIIMIAALFMYCESNSISGTESFLHHEEKECNSACSCHKNNFSPICDIYGVNHFSACTAGCYQPLFYDKKVGFSNCSCISKKDNDAGKVFQAIKGLCSQDCNKLWPYIMIIIVSKLFASSARVGNILVTLRCVDEADKSLALGAVEFLISVLATIPNPILYGYIIDNSCLLWEEVCGVQGNCLLYNTNLLRYYLHGLSIFFIFLGACCDFVVFVLSSRMRNFYEVTEETDRCNQELFEVNNVNRECTN